MKKVVVTGGSGGAGRYVIQHLVTLGYDILNLDIIPPKSNQHRSGKLT